MKTRLQLAGLALCGVVLAIVALRAPDRAPRVEAAFTLAPGEAVPSAIEVPVPAGYAVRTYDVEGMCCKGCPRTIYEHLRALPEVVEAAVSFETGTASVLAPRDFPSERLMNVIASEKYAVTPHPPSN